MISWLKPAQRAKTSLAHQDSEQWISVSDLMAGLMMVFLFIAVALMLKAQREQDRMREVAVAYQETKVSIYNDLVEEFSDDMESWDARIDQKTLSFEFRSPDVLFKEGVSTLEPRFKSVLADFFPRYMDRLQAYRDSIEEVRIEGHTDSRWNEDTGLHEAYFRNMRLSQARTRGVLQYAYSLPETIDYRDQIRDQLAAVGMSSSKVRWIKDENGEETEIEDREASRRVSFRIITNAETKIQKILQFRKLGSVE